MRNFEKFIAFCKRFHNWDSPKLKFKEIDEHYCQLYREIYGIDNTDVNKASFFIFVLSFCILVFLSVIIIKLNILIIILYSVIFSLIISYKFSLTLFKDLNKLEAEINAILYLIKIDYSLILKTLKPNSDYCLSFIKLIKDYKFPILKNFNRILKRIHEGATPEEELINIVTPSRDFNLYLKSLLINNFDNWNDDYTFKDSKLEKDFKIYLKEIQSKISIIFFIGVFFPIGLCFLILFQLINIIIMIFLIPLFLFTLNFLCRRFIRRNTYMIGVLNDYSGLEKKKFNEFLLFLKSFAINLKNNLSPEKAFLKSYTQNKNLFIVLEKPVKNQLSRLLNFNCSFHDMIHFFKLELNSIRYNVILDVIDKFVAENPYSSTEKIFDILNILYKHQQLEKKLEIIIKGEKFKIFFFIFLLPILIGAISGMFPFFILMTRNINSNGPITLIGFNNIINFSYIAIIFFVFISSISITSNYFLEIIKNQKKYLIILVSNLIFILTFICSFINILNFT
ncbi:MAG: hypothetical protein ACFE9N_06190 [Promethearchaeota archaeon]